MTTPVAVIDIESKALSIPEQAAGLLIVTAEDYTEAAELLLSIKSVQKEIDASYDPIIAKAHEAHKEALAQKKKVEAPLREAERIIKPKLAAYDLEQERKAREVEIKAQEEARKQEEELRLAEAVELEASGNIEDAQIMLDSPVFTPAVSVNKATPKVEGITYRETWAYEITDINRIPREYLKVDEAKIGQVVRALKSACNIAGIRVYNTRSVAARGEMRVRR